MGGVVISGTGVFTPPDAVSNEKLVDSFNEHSKRWNAENAAAIEAGELQKRELSSVEFIEKASGVKSRYMMEGGGATEVGRMFPYLSKYAPETNMGTPAQVRMAFEAAQEALEQAKLSGSDIDMVIISASVWERFVPSMATELQQILGAKGFAFDMSMACSSATFGMSTAMDALNSGMANKALVVTAEYITPLMNYEERDSHFIFGDAAVAMVLEREDETKSDCAFRINSRRLKTEFSTNIQAGFGSRALIERETIGDASQRFIQHGRTVFKELLPMVVELISEHLDSIGKKVDDFKRFWLHQANINMNIFATKKLIGREPNQEDAPIVLDEYANTAGAGCMIAFHKHKDDFKPGDLGIICSFGASYSIGCFEVERL